MNQLLFDRSAGYLSPQAFARIQTSRLIHAVQYAAHIRFNGGETPSAADEGPVAPEGQSVARDTQPKIWAHQAGVNALVIDPFEGRLLLSGGADSSIKLWDLQKITPSLNRQVLTPSNEISKYVSIGSIDLKVDEALKCLSFYPFDFDAFLSSSYDHTLKLYATTSLVLSASFNLDSIIYTHALSPIASHLLVACATQHPAIRLVDLRSGSNTHSLAGHQGAVVSAAWSPTNEHILSSGGVDGTARIWDVRKSAGTLGLLDMEDSVGILAQDGVGLGATARASVKAHSGAVNAISWTDDGSHIITAGHDSRVRVWDAATGANTLASFGPTLKNTHLSTLSLLSTPTALTPPRKELLFYPNENEILLFELHEGRLIKRMKVPGPTTASLRSRAGERNVRNRVTALAWRGPVDGVFSGHTDGLVRAWVPKTREDEEVEREEQEENTGEGLDEGSKRKRAVLEDVFRDLTRAKITFG